MENINKYEWAILITIVTITVSYVVIQMRACHSYNLKSYIAKNKDTLKWSSLENVLECVDNGDLIFMAGDTRGERICRWCTGSMFSHVGMLFREKNSNDEDVVYIWEADLGQSTKDGPRVIKLTDKLNKYKGFRYFAYRSLNIIPGCSTKRPKLEDILSIINEYGTYDFDDTMMKWWVSEKFKFLLPLFKDTNKVFCSELIALTMQRLGMIDDNKIPEWYSPESFVSYVSGLKFQYNYSPMTYVEF